MLSQHSPNYNSCLKVGTGRFTHTLRSVTVRIFLELLKKKSQINIKYLKLGLISQFKLIMDKGWVKVKQKLFFFQKLSNFFLIFFNKKGQDSATNKMKKIRRIKALFRGCCAAESSHCIITTAFLCWCSAK